MIKKVVLDKADRLYHFPFDLEDFFPRPTITARDKRSPILDLGRFHWKVKDDSTGLLSGPSEPASTEELLALKEKLAAWLQKELGISVDPRREIYLGHGIRRTIFDFCFTFVEYGEIVLCPEPGMPFYRRHTIASGGIPVSYPLTERTGFKPAFKRISFSLGKSSRILILNSPHNPMGTVLDDTELGELVRIASRHNIFIVNDAAYAFLSEERHFSILAIPGGNKVALEVFSFPFTFGLPYLPFGFAVGPSEIIGGLDTISRTTGVFLPRAWIRAASDAIGSHPSPALKGIKKDISLSRLAAQEMADRFGWRSAGNQYAPFLWLKIPGRRQAVSFSATLFRRRRIVTLPGTAFGENGDGYIRLSLTAPADDYRAAGERLARRIILNAREGD